MKNTTTGTMRGKKAVQLTTGVRAMIFVGVVFAAASIPACTQTISYRAQGTKSRGQNQHLPRSFSLTAVSEVIGKGAVSSRRELERLEHATTVSTKGGQSQRMASAYSPRRPGTPNQQNERINFQHRELPNAGGRTSGQARGTPRTR